MHRPGAFEGRPPGGRMRTSFEAIFTLFFIGLIIGLPTDTDAQQGEELLQGTDFTVDKPHPFECSRMCITRRVAKACLRCPIYK